METSANHIAKDHRYIDKTKVYVAAGATDARHLNSTLLPTNVNAPTEFTYLLTDGSDTGPYLKAG